MPAPVRELPRVQDDPAERLFGYKYVVETLFRGARAEVALTVLSSAKWEARAVCQVYRLPFVKDLENTSCDPRLGYANDRVPCATCHATDDCPDIGDSSRSRCRSTTPSSSTKSSRFSTATAVQGARSTARLG